MENKKGFTLVELLATITILGILLGIAIPSVMGYMNRGKETYYHSLEDSVLNSARDYLIDYRSLYPREIGSTISINGDELSIINILPISMMKMGKNVMLL